MPASPLLAYSYAVEREEPLLDGREAMFQAAASGFWMAARMAYDSMRADVDDLNATVASGLAEEFTTALSQKDAEALRSAFVRAASHEILRRLAETEARFYDYETAKLSLAAANRFYLAVAADLAPDQARIIAEQMPRALDSLGNPGLLGAARVLPKIQDFETARDAIAATLALRGE